MSLHRNVVPRSILSLLFLLATCCNLAVAAPNDTDESAPLNYTLDLSDAKNHYVRVTLELPSDGKQTELMMAVWTPGSYLVREYARHVDSIECVNEKGAPLKFEKTRKNRWIVQSKSAKQIKFSYRLYCNEMSVRTNWLDRQFAIFANAATFITSPKRLDEPHRVQLILPNGWTRSATSLIATGDQPHTYWAKDFDELVDSPIVAGNLEVFPFTVSGVEHQLVNIGSVHQWDGTKAATDLKRIVAEHHQLWGVVPYDRYLFLNVICESGGGLEHDNSTMLMTSRWAFRDQKSYRNWLSLASHEFFHTWNVRRLRPKSLIEYDYENEVYTESLWIAEGITSYYEDLELVRAGLFDQKEYLERLSANILSVQSANGRKIQSLTDSSFDSWIKFYRPDENSGNTRTNYYSKGAVVAFLLDTKIRKLTDGKKSLDDVMRAMFELFADQGYTAEDFRATAGDIAGEDLSEWFRNHVDSTTDLDFSDVEWLGLQTPGVANTSSKKKPEPVHWLGFRTGGGDGRLLISGVESDSPATEAGVNPNDELIAINGFRVAGSIDQRLKQFEIGDEIKLLIARRGELIELPITIGQAVTQDWKLKPIAKPTKAQSKRLKEWLE